MFQSSDLNNASKYPTRNHSHFFTTNWFLERQKRSSSHVGRRRKWRLFYRTSQPLIGNQNLSDTHIKTSRWKWDVKMAKVSTVIINCLVVWSHKNPKKILNVFMQTHRKPLKPAWSLNWETNLLLCLILAINFKQLKEVNLRNQVFLEGENCSQHLSNGASEVNPTTYL